MVSNLLSPVLEEQVDKVVKIEREPFKELQNIMDHNSQDEVKMSFDDYQYEYSLEEY